jgi:hypothetical protein
MGSNLGALTAAVLAYVLYKTEFFVHANQSLANKKPDSESDSSIMRNLAAVQHDRFLHADKLFS